VWAASAAAPGSHDNAYGGLHALDGREVAFRCRSGRVRHHVRVTLAPCRSALARLDARRAGADAIDLVVIMRALAAKQPHLQLGGRLPVGARVGDPDRRPGCPPPHGVPPGVSGPSRPCRRMGSRCRLDGSHRTAVLDPGARPRRRRRALHVTEPGRRPATRISSPPPSSPMAASGNAPAPSTGAVGATSSAVSSRSSSAPAAAR
jgi:hypothetical protein